MIGNDTPTRPNQIPLPTTSPELQDAHLASTQLSHAAAQNIDRHGKPWWSQPQGGRRFTNPADRCPGETLYHLHPRPVHSYKSAVQVHVGLPCRYSCGCSRPISDAVRAPADDGEQGRSSIAGAGVRSSDRVGHATYGPVRFQLRPSGHQHAPAPRVPVLYADVRIVTRTPSNSCSSRLRGDRCSCATFPVASEGRAVILTLPYDRLTLPWDEKSILCVRSWQASVSPNVAAGIIQG